MAKIKVTQIGSPIRREASQRATLIGLGLNKMHKTRELEDSPEVRGMIRKVRHMVTVSEACRLRAASSRRRPGSQAARVSPRAWPQIPTAPASAGAAA